MGVNAETGERDYVSRTVRGARRDAEIELTKLLRQVDEGAVAPRAGSVGELVETWYRYREPYLSPPVAYNYRRIIDRFIRPRWGTVSLRRVRISDLDAWYSKLAHSGGVGGRGLSANSVRRIHAVLRAALDQGVIWGFVGSNPAASASPPRLGRRQIELTLTKGDIRRLIETARGVNPGLPIFFRLAFSTGARRGELCALRWLDIDLERGIVRIARALVQANGEVVEKDPKTHQIRTVSIDPGTLEMLRIHRDACASACASAGGHLGNDAFVFSHVPDGITAWKPGYVTQAFCRLRNQLGLKSARLHDLRHASASFLLASGVDVPTVSGRLGHAHASTTLDIYGHVIHQADERAATALGTVLDEGTP